MVVDWLLIVQCILLLANKQMVAGTEAVLIFLNCQSNNNFVGLKYLIKAWSGKVALSLSCQIIWQRW
jgi:hypothetical protein